MVCTDRVFGAAEYVSGRVVNDHVDHAHRVTDQHAGRLARHEGVPHAHDMVETARHDDVERLTVVEALDPLREHTRRVSLWR